MNSRHAIALQEQVIQDLPSGLTITVWRTPSGEGRVRIEGDPSRPARDLQFSPEGVLVGSGSVLATACPLRLVT
jgi:hypothetical protein